MNGITIRPMELKDIPAVHAIDVQSFNLPWPANSFRFELTENPSTRCWVAEWPALEGRPAMLLGMLVMWIVIDEGHIGTIAVHADYRQMGIGSQILQHAIEQARASGVIKIFLEVRRSNVSAQKMYEKFGFTVEGVRQRYYKDNREDALLMTRYL